MHKPDVDAEKCSRDFIKFRHEISARIVLDCNKIIFQVKNERIKMTFRSLHSRSENGIVEETKKPSKAHSVAANHSH